MESGAAVSSAPTRSRRVSLLIALRCLGALSLAVAAVAATAAPAAAYGPTLSCAARAEQSPFTRWGDYATYFRLPNGGFEAGSSDWLLSGGASVVWGNEPWKVGSSTDALSLQLPAGATAESHTMCVTMGEDGLRLFAYNNKVSGAILHVDAIARNPITGQVGQTAFDVNADASPYGWAPTMRLQIPNLLGGSGTQELTIRFSTRGTPATWGVDDVYLDPIKSF